MYVYTHTNSARATDLHIIHRLIRHTVLTAIYTPPYTQHDQPHTHAYTLFYALNKG